MGTVRAETAVEMPDGWKGGSWVRLENRACVQARNPKSISGLQSRKLHPKRFPKRFVVEK